MPIFLNRKSREPLPKGKRRIAPVRPSRSIAVNVRRAIFKALGPLTEEVGNLIPWLQGTATPAQAAQVMRELQDRWRQVFGVKADQIARAWVAHSSAHAKERLEASIARALGIDMTRVFDDETVRDAATLMENEARDLITSIPAEHLAKVQQAVTHNYMQLPLPEDKNLEEYIQDLTGITQTRVRTIARDQTSKINTAVNMARQTSIGIEEYTWRTAKDSRVVGTPGGLYPEGNAVHGNHYKREGQTFRWDTPPSDGHPGYPIKCRCYSEPIIDVNQLKEAA